MECKHKPVHECTPSRESRRDITEQMEAKLQIFAVMLLFCLCSRGDALCSLKDLAVTQTTLPGQIGGNPEYRVTVKNGCICTQSDVKLACPGFNSSMQVNPDIIRLDADGKLCTLSGGGPVRNGDVITFDYAWSTQFSFAPVSSTVSCS